MAGKSRAGALAETICAASGAADHLVPTLLMSAPGGLEAAVEGTAWNTHVTCESATVLARLPEDGACSELIFHCFAGSDAWLKRFLEVGEHLSELLHRKTPTDQIAVANAWMLLGRRIAQADADGGADMARVRLLRSIQQGVSDYLAARGPRALGAARPARRPRRRVARTASLHAPPSRTLPPRAPPQTRCIAPI